MTGTTSSTQRKHAASSCKGCRLSKVRCDLEACESSTCSRCERLGLVCIPNEPSRRGRHGNVAGTIKRLGPAVRALMKPARPSPNGAASEAPSMTPGGLLVAQAPARPIAVARQLEEEVWQQYRDELLRLDTPEGYRVRLVFVKSAFSTAKRHQSWELTNEGLRMASELRVTLDDAMRMMTLGSESVDPSAPPPSEAMLPEFVAEWHGLPLPCITRVEVPGGARYFYNAAFPAWWQHIGASLEELEQACIACDDLYWNDAWWNGGVDRSAARLWVETIARARDPEQMCFVEGPAPAHVNVLVNGSRVSLRMRMRVAFRPGGETYECYLLEDDAFICGARVLGMRASGGAPCEPAPARVEPTASPAPSSAQTIVASDTVDDVLAPRGADGAATGSDTSPVACTAHENLCGVLGPGALLKPGGGDAAPTSTLHGAVAGASSGDGGEAQALELGEGIAESELVQLITEELPLEQLLQLVAGSASESAQCY